MQIEAAIRDKARNLLGEGDTLADAIGIVFTKLTRSEVIATMPVDTRTVQPVRILHGGASVALAETVMSVGALLNLDDELNTVVGLEINANHIRPVPEGDKVTATANPIHIGTKTQVWETRITNQNGKLVTISRCTLAVIPLPGSEH